MDQRRNLGKRSHPRILAALKRTRGRVNCHAGPLFLIGLLGILLHQWNYRQRDRRRQVQIQTDHPEPPLESWPRIPKVSALVAAWNEAGHIQAHVESFLKLCYPNKELILVAGGEDGTYNLAEVLTNIQVKVYKQKPEDGKQRALQKAFEASNGEIIFLTDADCLFDEISFQNTLYPIIQGLHIVTGSHEPFATDFEDEFVMYQWLLHEYGSWRNPEYVTGIDGRNCAIRRETLIELGEFQDPVKIGTDSHLAELAITHGHRIRYLPYSRVQTEHPSTFTAYIKQQSRWQRNLMIHGIPVVRRRMVLTFIFRSLYALAQLLGVFTLFLDDKIFTLIWGLLVSDGYLSRIRILNFGNRSERKHQISTPNIFQVGVFYLLEIISWLVPWKDYFTKSQRTSW